MRRNFDILPVISRSFLYEIQQPGQWRTQEFCSWGGGVWGGGSKIQLSTKRKGIWGQ